jgi:hypothetical protein
VSPPPDRPLKLGELLAETIRVYGERVWASFGLGAVVATGFLLTFVLPTVVEVIVSAIFFTGAYAAAARVAAGDSFVEAWAQVGLRLPVLAVLAFVVSIPFVLALEQLFLLLLAVAWLGVSGFSIPIAMLERDPDGEGWFGRLSYALYRSVALARAEYLHAVGVVAALVLLSLLLGILLAAALVGFAENGRVVSAALAQVVLAPFFFLGLSVLYFEQRARAAVSSPREKSA